MPGGDRVGKNLDTVIIRALCNVLAALMYVGIFIVLIGLDLINIILPSWLKITLIAIMGIFVMAAITIDERMQIIEEERNGRKEKLE